MSNIKLIKSFYNNYRQIYTLINEELIKNNISNESIKISKVIDKLIIYVFILENLLNESEKLNLTKEVYKNGYNGIIKFYNNPNEYLIDNVNTVTQITKLFSINVEEKKIFLSNELIVKILKILNKYNWKIDNSNRNVNIDITPDVLGNVFEKYINKKENAAYYTEKDTINYINNNTIIYSLLNKLNLTINIIDKLRLLDNNFYNINSIEDLIKENIDVFYVLELIIKNINNLETLNSIKNILNKIKIADITCGTGAFLVETIELLEKLHKIIDIKLSSLHKNYKVNSIKTLIHIIENNVYGVDIMEDAIEIAKFRLYLKVIIECIRNNSDIKIDINVNLKVGNTLIGTIDNTIENNIIDLIAITKINEPINTFNWNIEFPDIIQSGGFDCIVGNPPYKEYKNVSSRYKVKNYKTEKCNNLYAFTTERAVNLLKENGVLGFIVPISIVSTPRMSPLRDLLRRECSSLFYSNFGDRPGTLFNGVHQKVTIVIGQKKRNNKCKIYTSKYYHWYEEERSQLFNNIKYIENNFEEIDCIYKFSENIEQSILNKVQSKNISLSNLYGKNGEYYSFLSQRLTFWVKCFNTYRTSNEFKKYIFNQRKKALVFTAIMNSSLYYYFWEVISDEWHITNKELNLFKFNFNELSREDVEILCDLALELENDLEKNKVYIGSKQVEYEYKHKKSKLIIDKIDLVLKRYYGLNDEEFQFIIDYNLRYRLNEEYNNYINNRQMVNVEEE